ncbi:hypothetical protein IG631_15516 [Alternaria alternata]|nr:hypothetical protein IG631_15516 [Alternaria alternata]
MGTVTRELTIASVRCGYQGITTFSTMCTFLVVINPFEDSQHESRLSHIHIRSKSQSTTCIREDACFAVTIFKYPEDANNHKCQYANSLCGVFGPLVTLHSLDRHDEQGWRFPASIAALVCFCT